MTDDPPKILILGASCRLALDLIPQLFEHEFRPIFTFRTPKGEERILAKLAQCSGKKAELIKLDLHDPATLANLGAALKEPPTHLADFAQGDYESLVAGADEDTVLEYFNANISCRAALLKRVARAMLTRRRGRLVFISSAAAAKPSPGQGFYAAAKLACEALYRNLGLEMAAKGITTAIVRPGYVDVGRGRRFLEKEKQTAKKLRQVGRIIEAGNVTAALLFLLLQGGPGVNGTILTLDGGMGLEK